MTTKITYTCDLCGSEQESEEQFWEVGLILRTHAQARMSHLSVHADKSLVEACRPCVEKLQLLPFSAKIPKKDPPMEMTVGEKLEALVGEISTYYSGR